MYTHVQDFTRIKTTYFFCDDSFFFLKASENMWRYLNYQFTEEFRIFYNSVTLKFLLFWQTKVKHEKYGAYPLQLY